jgi:hypothetical protein
MPDPATPEHLRLGEDARRQWGTVREDYSADGDAWNYLPHDHARSRPYRWGEDGLLGISEAGRVAERNVRRQLELARPDLAADELSADRGAGALPSSLGRRLAGRVSDRVGELDESLASGARVGAAADSLFLPDEKGHSSCFGGDVRYASDPHWKDHVLFHEHFRGETGRGLGATHQTGWTALITHCLNMVARDEEEAEQHR